MDEKSLIELFSMFHSGQIKVGFSGPGFYAHCGGDSPMYAPYPSAFEAARAAYRWHLANVVASKPVAESRVLLAG